MAQPKEFEMVFLLRAQLDSSMKQFSTVDAQIKELEEQVQRYNRTLGNIDAYRHQQTALQELVRQQNETAAAWYQASQSFREETQRREEAARAVEAHRAELERLKQAIDVEKRARGAEVDALRAEGASRQQVAEATKRHNDRLRELEAAQKREKEALKASKDALNEATNAEKEAQNRTNDLQASKDRLTQKIADERQKLRDLAEELRKAGVDTKGLEEAERNLNAQLDETVRKQEQLAAFRNKINNIADTFRVLAQAANGANRVLEPMVGLMKESLDSAATLEYAMSAVEAISGATEDEARRMTAVVKEMGATTVYTAKESADAMQNMALAGWDAEQMIAGLPAVIKMAAASGEDLAEVTSIVSDGMNAFQLSGERAAVMFADVLAKAATSSNTNIGLMGQSLSYVETTAGNLGYTIQDVSVALAAMANNALKGGVSGSALNTMLTRMSGANETAAVAMEELGLSMYDTQGQAKPLLEYLNELRRAFQNFNGDAQSAQVAAYKLAGMRGMRGLLAIVNQSDEQWQKLTEDVYNYAGASEQISSIRMDNYTGQLYLLTSAWDALKTSIGEEFLPTATDALEILTDITTRADEWVQNHGSIVRGIAVTTTTAWGLFKALSAVAGVVMAIRMAAMILPAGALASVLGTVGALAGVSIAAGAAVALFSSEAYKATKAGTEFKKSLDDEITSEKELIETNRELLDGLGDESEKRASRENLIEQYTADLENFRKAADDAIAKRDEFIQHLKDTGHYGTWENWNGEIVVDVNSMTTTEAKSLRDFEAAADDAKAAADELEAEIARLQAEQEAQTRATMAERGVSQDLYEVFANAEDAAKALAEAYVTLYQETEEAYEKQFTLFELVEKETASLKDMEAALDSQKEYWAEYGENLDKVGEAARDAGIDLSGMWSFLASGSTDAAAAVAALAASIKGGDTTELEELVGKYDAMIEARTKATEYATEGFDEIQKKWEEVQKQIEDNVEGSEAYVAAYTAMEETFKGYLDGVDVGSSRVEAALSAAASRWKRSILNTPSNNGYVSTATLRAYAGGTDSARRGVALVGEEGPELMYLRGGEEIVPADKTREMLNRLVADRERAESSRVIDFPRISEAVGGGSGGDIHIEINVAGDATPETVRRLEDYSADLERRIRKVIREENTDARRRAFA